MSLGDIKRALVTGASRGIGKAIAIELCHKGYEVIVHYNNNKEQAQDVWREIHDNGNKAYLINGNIGDHSDVIEIATKCFEEFGGINLLINNAGISYKRTFWETTLYDINSFMDVNFKGTYLLTQEITRRMIEGDVKGSVYTITSINGISPGIGFSGYGASKGALECAMKGVALELAQYNIMVNTIAIGGIMTDINSSVWKDKEKLQMVNSSIPLGRLGRPSEVARTLCSIVESNSYMTGNTIVIDGGWLLKHGYEKLGLPKKI